MPHHCCHLSNRVENTHYIPDIPHTLQWMGRLPFKTAPSLCSSKPPSKTQFLPWSYPSPYPKWHLNLFSSFCRANGCDRQTDTQWYTDHGTLYGNNRPHVIIAQRCDLTRWRNWKKTVQTYGKLLQWMQLDWPPVQQSSLSALEDVCLLLTDRRQTARQSLCPDSMQSQQCPHQRQAEQLQTAEADIPSLTTAHQD